MADDGFVGPVIEMTDVGRVYPGPPPVTALRPSSLTVAAGDYLAIVGPSGSGKSTLLNICGLLDRPSTGRYRLCGTDVADAGEAERTALRSRLIGFVFQSFHLMPHRTAVENVALAQVYRGVPRADRIADATRWLTRVGLGHRATALPTTLSGGERQRVAIARALAQEPSLLLCDEPTGNLDTATADGVLDLIDALRSDGVTIMIITHDSTVASRADRTVSIRDGRLA